MIGKLLRIKTERDDISLYLSRQGTVRTPLKPGDVLCRLPISADEAVVYPAEIYVVSRVGVKEMQRVHFRRWVLGEATEDL